MREGNADFTLDTDPMAALFWFLCWLHEIPAERTRLDRDSAGGSALMYCPDFRVAVPKMLDVYVELSDGQDEGTLRPLRDAWRTAVQRTLVVVYREQLYDLREASRPAQFVARLRMIDDARVRASRASG